MTWQKLPPYSGMIHQGCLHAPSVTKIAPLDLSVGVGFGTAQITKDDEIIYDEDMLSDDGYTSPLLSEFEAMAREDPDHDWRCLLYAPLRGEEYQRQGDDTWVLVDSNQGFA